MKQHIVGVAKGERVTLHLTLGLCMDEQEIAALSVDLFDDLVGCMTPGRDAQPEVDHAIKTYTITADENIRDHLRGYGTWDEDELSNHDDNIQRAVWLIGCDLFESGEFCIGE